MTCEDTSSNEQEDELSSKGGASPKKDVPYGAKNILTSSRHDEKSCDKCSDMCVEKSQKPSPQTENGIPTIKRAGHENMEEDSKLPKIVAEHRPQRRERKFPGGVIHPYSRVKEVGDWIPMLLSKRAEERIRNHCTENVDSEAMGLMVGNIYFDKDIEYALIKDIVTSPLHCNAVHVAFDHDAIENLAMELDGLGFDYLILGWYHSHPGHGCFMSDTDIKTQASCFSSPHSCALVFDPVNREMAFYRIRDGLLQEYAVVVYVDTYEDPFYVREIGGEDK